ncbi:MULTISPECIES: carboxyl-terminal processing protease CtpA [unclassified Leptolyngbya]|uniref:carboxyl-terminal processing protease CtpA n=1 Tax=unclassified Leptolyngbya TaxID=2650499 RepID=UPI0016826A2D|nr:MULTISPECIES: carboxyl-terminal processing protease CtpA [unclassified Leptolyngbya]MBD1912884.1 PDZ domain-containing protein [Leptolyngbya sp. FACHB-8]MBD2154787.1 PDZ domain-containing protein [Leptolyngbya sp. FACHB-16]
MKRWILRFGLLLLVLVASLSLWTPASSAFTDEQKLLSEVWRIVDRAYVDSTFNHQNWWMVRQKALQQRLDTRDDAYSAIQKMLASLDDPYTRLLKPDQYRSLQTNTSGELNGIGLQITQELETGDLRVIAPIEGSPADRAGIQPNDRILKINGVPAKNLTLDEAAERMRGPVGTIVELTLGRDEGSPEDVQLVRDRITLNPVVAELRNEKDLKIGYIRLSQFNANAASEVAHAVGKLDQQGAVSYILDLRNNPGGLLQAGIDIARLWLDDATVVYTVNRDGIQDSFFAHGQALTDKPLVVLVNQGTASASEILAGALQDNHRAQLVGDRTFGKGLIQSLFSLSDGSGLAVTIARYETPDHHDINRQGIMPDVVIEADPLNRNQLGTDVDPQFQAAVECLTKQVTVAQAS